MQSPVETQTATAPPSPDRAVSDGTPLAGATQPAVHIVQRDMAGQVIERAPLARVDDECGYVSARVHAPVSPLCAPHPISDPTSVGPIIVAVISGILIICGTLTFNGRGPGKLIRPKPRRRGATHRARNWRRRIGGALVLMGIIGLARTFL